MTHVNITDAFAVSPQVQPEDLQSLAEEGFTTVICNRPDDEEPGQPSAMDMRTAAEAAGMAFHHIPVAGGAFPDSAVTAFAEVPNGAAGKTLAYCRTGTRSITLDALANVECLTAGERIARASAAGYDLSAMHDRLAHSSD